MQAALLAAEHIKDITRPVEWNIPWYLVVILYITALSGMGLAAWQITKKTRKAWEKGPAGEGVGWFMRIWNFVWDVVLQRRVARETFAGIMHMFIWLGFVVLILGTGIVFLDKDTPLVFWYGKFYIVSKFVLNTAGLLFLIGILLAMWRRYVIRPDRLNKNTKLDALVLPLLFTVGVTGFLVQGVRIAAAIEGVKGARAPGGFNFEKWAYVGWWIGKPLSDAMSGNAIKTLHLSLWILHLAVVLALFVAFAYTKLSHAGVSATNLTLRRKGPVGAMSYVDLEREDLEVVGTGTLADVTPRAKLDLLACTECGRCQDRCPAWMTGKPLSPKWFILEMRDAMLGKPAETAVPGEVIDDEETWSCTNCRACANACPVGIDHVEQINDVRRNLVLIESRFPSEAAATFRNMENSGNPWGLGQHTRAEWAQGLDVPLISEKRDVEYLYWVGCAASFDDRHKEVSRAFVKLLKGADVSFAILGPEETCTGDAARRLGNEFLFQSLAKQNIETINGYGVKKIVCTCPHCYNTLKNEYPQFGGNFEVYHHSQLLTSLLMTKRLKAVKNGNGSKTKVTFHDSCFLGRYNNIFGDPRNVLRSIPGVKVAEMQRNRGEGLCCGAGGGRMWLEETIGKRVNVERAEEAIDTGAPTIAAACPFCATMLADGVGDKGASETVRVTDIAVLLAEAVFGKEKKAVAAAEATPEA